MDFKVQLSALQEAVDKAAVAVTSKDIMPVLKNLLLQVEKGKLLIMGTDLEITLLSFIPCIGEDGKILIDAAKFKAIVDRAEGEEFSLEQHENKVKIEVGRAKHNIVCLDVTEYPIVEPFDKKAEFFTVDREPLLANLERVTHAVCRDETRANLMLVSMKGNQMVATDGKRLAVSRFETQDKELNLPATSVDGLIKILALEHPLQKDALDQVLVQPKKEFLYFQFEEDTFSIRASSAQFPAIEKWLKQTDKHELTVNFEIKHLIEVLQRVSVSADENSGAVKVVLSSKEVRILAKDTTGNTSEEILPIEVSGLSNAEKFGSYFNYEHLIEALRVLVASSVRIKFGRPSKNKPAPLRIDEEGYTEIVMPTLAEF